MLASLLLATALWPLAVTQDCEPSDNTIMIGVAQNAAGNHLYCELVSQPDEKSLDVSYVRGTKVFAEKKLGYRTNSATPSVVQKDFRFGELRQAHISEQAVELHYQANTNKKLEKVIIPIAKVDVIDAGFDNFIRDHWDKLQEGETLSVNFASMSHLKTLPLRIRAQYLEKCVNRKKHINPTFCFSVEVDNAFLRLLLGNIKLGYDNSRRLIEFNGVVNILDEKEATQTATISYYYQQDYVEK